MARSKDDPGDRTERFEFRLSPSDLQEIREAAERNGENVSSWVRRMALAAARDARRRRQ